MAENEKPEVAAASAADSAADAAALIRAGASGIAAHDSLRDAGVELHTALAAVDHDDYDNFSDQFKAGKLADPACVHCHGSGYVGKGVMAPICPCVLLAQNRYAAEVRIGALFGAGDRRMTFATFNDGGIAQNVRAKNISTQFVLNWERAKERGWILGFEGRPGSGKTHLVNAIAMALVKREFIKPAVMNVPEMFFLEKQRFGLGRGQQVESQIQRAIDADLTVLDDLGAEMNRKDTDSKAVNWVQETLYIILEQRIRHARPTIYTTNLTKAELKEHFGDGTAGERLYSRIERAMVRPPVPVLPVDEDLRFHNQEDQALLEAAVKPAARPATP
jgi:hypothetical protein